MNTLGRKLKKLKKKKDELANWQIKNVARCKLKAVSFHCMTKFTTN